MANKFFFIIAHSSYLCAMLSVNVKRAILLAVGVLAYAFVAYRIAHVGADGVFEAIAGGFTAENIPLIALVVAMMLAVWSVEAVKWDFATRGFAKRSFWANWRSVWYGLAVGQFTPNRIGEPFGRVAFIAPESRGKALAASVWCSFSQQLATLFFGAVGLLLFISSSAHSVAISSATIIATVGFIAIWAALLIALIFRFSWLLRKIEKWRIVQRLLKGESLQFTLGGATASLIILLSTFKYILFSTQYVILFRVFGVEADVFALYTVVMLNYLIITFIPSFVVTELGVRLGVAVYLMEFVAPDIAGVVPATATLWLINIALPVAISVWFRR